MHLPESRPFGPQGPQLPSPGDYLPPMPANIPYPAAAVYPGDEQHFVPAADTGFTPPPYAGAEQDQLSMMQASAAQPEGAPSGEAQPEAPAPSAAPHEQTIEGSEDRAALPTYSEETVQQAMGTLAPWLDKYRHADLVDLPTLVDAAVADDPSNSALPGLFGKAVLERVREERRAAPQGVPRPTAEHMGKSAFRNIEARFNEWGAELAATNAAATDLKMDDMVRRMTRFVDRFANRNNLTELPMDDAVLKAMWDAYCTDVLALKTQAGLKRPEINAEYHEAGPIIEEIQNSEHPGRARDLANRKPADPVGAMRGNSELIAELSQAYAADGTVSAGLVRQVVHSRREQARGTLETYVQQLGEAVSQHSTDPGADEMFEFLRTHHVADPDQWIQRCLGRQEMLTAAFAEDPDFANSHVLGHLSSRTTSDDPKVVVEAGRAYKATLARLRAELASNPADIEVSEDVIRIVAASVKKTSIPAVHVIYAIEMQEKINAGQLTL